jgi:hypothetical protein
MSRMSTPHIAQGHVRLHVLERHEGPDRLAASAPAVAKSRRGSSGPSRRGFLRLAPRLTLLTGGRREPAWQRIAGGIGAALAGDATDEFPLDCA